MRLTCPNCGAEYEVPEGMLPAGGRHVQCTACHTRWFVRGPARPAPSEDAIIRRLETRPARPRPVPVPDPMPEPDEPAPFLWEDPAAAEPPPDADEPPSAPAPAADLPLPEPPLPAATVPQPRPLSTPAPEPLARRPAAPRLDLSPASGAEPPPRAPSRFGRGLLAAIALFSLALGAYVFADPIAARVPAAAPALEAFAAAVDGWREALAARLGEPEG